MWAPALKPGAGVNRRSSLSNESMSDLDIPFPPNITGDAPLPARSSLERRMGYPRTTARWKRRVPGDVKMISGRRAMINAGEGKTKRRVLFARAGRPKLDTFESHMTSFAALNAEFCSLIQRY